MMIKDWLDIDEYGTKRWFKDGKMHREDGPAYEDAFGSKTWWLNGKRHRVDGPAFDWRNGVQSWWINGVKINCKTNDEFLRLMKLKAFL